MIRVYRVRLYGRDEFLLYDEEHHAGTKNMALRVARGSYRSMAGFNYQSIYREQVTYVPPSERGAQ